MNTPTPAKPPPTTPPEDAGFAALPVFTPGDRVFLQPQDDRLDASFLDARITAAQSDRLTVRLLGPLGDASLERVWVLGRGADHRFVRWPAELACIEGLAAAQLLLGRIVLPAERRRAYRVPVVGRDLLAQVAGSEAWLLDVSTGGLSFVTGSRLSVGDFLPLQAEYGPIRAQGLIRLRHTHARADGLHRYGASIYQQGLTLARSLRAMAMAIQRDQIRRTEPDAGPDAGDPTPCGSAPRRGAPLADAGRDRRAHDRFRWSGELCVTLLAEHDRRTFTTRAADLSRGGLGFLCRFYLPVGTPLRVSLPAVGDGALTLRAEVRSCALAQAPWHRIGAVFSAVEEYAAPPPAPYDTAAA